MNNLDYKYIEQLVERYFAAETTLQEEQILRTFFTAAQAGELPQTLAQYAPLFATLGEQEKLDSDFDERLMAIIGEEESATGAPLVVKARTISLAQRLRPLFGAAAVVAILLTLGNAINQSFKNTDMLTEDEPVVAEDYQVAPTGDPAMAYDQSRSDSLALVMPTQILPGDSLPIH